MSMLEEEMDSIDQAPCLMSQEEIVSCLWNTANMFSSRGIIMEAACLLDDHNKTVQQFNLTTQVDNCEAATKEFQETIRSKVMLEMFTKTTDQSIILDHELKQDSEGQSSPNVDLLLDRNQFNSLMWNENYEVEREADMIREMELTSQFNEEFPRQRKQFEKNEKDEANFTMYTEANKYLEQMEKMRNITQRFLSDMDFHRVKSDPNLLAMLKRSLPCPKLKDYMQSVPNVLNVAENLKTISIQEESPNDEIQANEAEDSANDARDLNESIDSQDLNESVDSQDLNESNEEEEEDASMNRARRNGFRSAPNTTFRSGFNATRTTRNEVSGVERLDMNDSESSVESSEENERRSSLNYSQILGQSRVVRNENDDDELSNNQDGSSSDEAYSEEENEIPRYQSVRSENEVSMEHEESIQYGPNDLLDERESVQRWSTRNRSKRIASQMEQSGNGSDESETDRNVSTNNVPIENDSNDLLSERESAQRSRRLSTRNKSKRIASQIDQSENHGKSNDLLSKRESSQRSININTRRSKSDASQMDQDENTCDESVEEYYDAEEQMEEEDELEDEATLAEEGLEEEEEEEDYEEDEGIEKGEDIVEEFEEDEQETDDGDDGELEDEYEEDYVSDEEIEEEYVEGQDEEEYRHEESYNSELDNSGLTSISQVPARDQFQHPRGTYPHHIPSSHALPNQIPPVYAPPIFNPIFDSRPSLMGLPSLGVYGRGMMAGDRQMGEYGREYDGYEEDRSEYEVYEEEEVYEEYERMEQEEESPQPTRSKSSHSKSSRSQPTRSQPTRPRTTRARSVRK